MNAALNAKNLINAAAFNGINTVIIVFSNVYRKLITCSTIVRLFSIVFFGLHLTLNNYVLEKKNNCF